MMTLEAVLAYKNNQVIEQFCRENPEISGEKARQTFEDLLAWLWLSENRHQRQLKSHMIAPLIPLDKIWHVFILHTRSYAEFCQHYFNRYLHHEVEHHGKESVLSIDELSAYLHDAYEHLGESWLIRNFELASGN